MIDTKNLKTEEVLKIAKQYAISHDISEIVIASTRGDTAVSAANIFPKSFNLVAVTHSTGFKKPGVQEFSDAHRLALQEKNVMVFTGPMIFHTWNDYYRKKQGTLTTTSMIADTLRLFGQGTKVAVEIVAIAADAGLIGKKPVLSIAGTGYGADTVLLIRPENSRRLMDIRILDVIAKPSNW